MPGCRDFRQTAARDHRDDGLTRRQALGVGLGAGLTVYLANAMPLTRVFEAAEAHAQASPAAPVLVSVFLPGGTDLLDSLVPLDQFGAYADLRPALKREDAVALGSTGIGVHPSLTRGARGGIKGLFDLGKVGFLPGIDYANPDLSHFHSRNFWQTGIAKPESAGLVTAATGALPERRTGDSDGAIVTPWSGFSALPP